MLNPHNVSEGIVGWLGPGLTGTLSAGLAPEAYEWGSTATQEYPGHHLQYGVSHISVRCVADAR